MPLNARFVRKKVAATTLIVVASVVVVFARNIICIFFIATGVWIFTAAIAVVTLQMSGITLIASIAVQSVSRFVTPVGFGLKQQKNSVQTKNVEIEEI